MFVYIALTNVNLCYYYFLNTPNLLHISSITSTAALLVGAVQLLPQAIRTTMYLLPCLVHGKSPTKSIPILENEVSVIGSVCRGATLFLRLPTL